MDVSPEEVEPLLDDIDFLCRTANRVVVLDALTEGPSERRELEERTGVSRPTLGRILGDFEERNWVSRNGREYRTTPVGDFIVDTLTTFLEQMATARTLAPVMQWLPTNGFGFDVTCLRDAEIVYATEDDPLAPIRLMDGQLQSGERVRLASYEITLSGLEAVWKATVNRKQELEAILTPGVYDTIGREPEMLTMFRELLDGEAAEFYVHTGERPTLIALIDDTACIGLSENGIPRAVLVSDDEEVRSWADDTFAEYRDRAEPVESATFVE